MSGCEGPAGAAGADGINGGDGINGVDANETCIVCHNDEVVLLAKQQQVMGSGHMSGGNYGRREADCAICHTHQGFIETLESGALETSGDIDDPAPINCRTCHMIHTNYDDGDWDLVTASAVDTDFGDWTIDIGESNLCVNCHQFRELDPMPEMGGADVEITSSRWGPHHGPQGNNVWGVGGYELTGSKNYPEPGSHAHAGAGCVTCHMAAGPINGIGAGWHSFGMTYDYHGSPTENTSSCEVCHSTLEDFEYGGTMEDVHNLLAEMDTIFFDNGWTEEIGDLWDASSSAPLTVSADEAGVMLNYKIVTEDRSGGIHNPAYMLALLTNSYEFLIK
jgi:hypothetical protein